MISHFQLYVYPGKVVSCPYTTDSSKSNWGDLVMLSNFSFHILIVIIVKKLVGFLATLDRFIDGGNVFVPPILHALTMQFCP